MKIIPKELLEKFYNAKQGEQVVRTYIDKSPLVRWLYWDRLKKMLKMGQKYKCEKVLDLGCGEGIFLPALSETFENIFGLDIDIRVAQKIVEYYNLDNVKLYESDIFNNSFDDNSFDIIYAASVLEHFPDREKIIKELARLLVPGGHLIFSSPTETWFYRLGRKVFGYVKPVDHYFSTDEIANVAKKYLKFTEIKQGPLVAPPFLAVYRIYNFEKKR